MLKRTILVSALLIGGLVSAQWTPTEYRGGITTGIREVKKKFFKLDVATIREQLKGAELQGKGAKAVVIAVPALDGTIEHYNVYSFPVLDPAMEKEYNVGSYTGVCQENPAKLIRFSVAPNDFQAMMSGDGDYTFISPIDKSQSIYAVHLKTRNIGSKPFVCSTDEGAAAKEIEQLASKNTLANNPYDFAKNSDQKYRTMRLAISVTGEYTQAFGGVAGAVAQINATMTRVNGVFEKDFALHLNVINAPQLIYADPATDPYSASTAGVNGAWNTELQTTLTNTIGNDAYDIGHLFGASGGGGNAGCIGCVCVNPTSATSKAKGSAFTSPAGGLPQGDNFDIDYVAHEMGHQLGDNHTFSHNLEGAGVNVEPGSGSTIMGYAGITGSATDVQPHSDPYFHAISIKQVQTNLNSKTCDVEVPITNTPPVINNFTAYTIPKSTAFVLTGNATDAQNDPMTYTWEQVDNATVTINKTNLGNTTTGASFRSVNPSTSLVRYFPALSTVMSGALKSTTSWEAVSTVARTSTFRFTARDNNPDISQQQTSFKDQTITVGNDGPFQITSQYMNAGVASPFTWDVANTASAPYNVPNVKIDYTTNNGTSWVTLAASTANDGTENLVFPSSLIGQTVKARVSAIDNVFYAVRQVTVAQFAACDGTAPTGLTASGATSTGITLTWTPVMNATYIIQYRPLNTTTWTTVSSANPTITLTGLTPSTTYEAQVAAVCGTTQGAFSASVNFNTTALTYCTATANSSSYEYISNVTLANVNNTSTGNKYSNYSAVANLQINLVKGTTYPLSVTKAWTGTTYPESVAVYIDYNRNGVFDTNELVMNSPASTTATVTQQITPDANAVENLPLRMRVIMSDGNTGDTYTTACGTFSYGEVEDYTVKIAPSLAVKETSATVEASIYPNPVADVLNVSKVSEKATFMVYNTAGQIVKEGKLDNGKVTVNELVRGNYMISIKDKDQTMTAKFIKK